MEGTDLMLIGLLVVAVPFALLLFLAGGPVLWAGVALVFVTAGAIKLIRSSGGDGERAPPKNCPDCGSPNDPDAAICDHCDASL